MEVHIPLFRILPVFYQRRDAEAQGFYGMSIRPLLQVNWQDVGFISSLSGWMQGILQCLHII